MTLLFQHAWSSDTMTVCYRWNGDPTFHACQHFVSPGVAPGSGEATSALGGMVGNITKWAFPSGALMWEKVVPGDTQDEIELFRLTNVRHGTLTF